MPAWPKACKYATAQAAVNSDVRVCSMSLVPAHQKVKDSDRTSTYLARPTRYYKRVQVKKAVR
jgi:hypothetical protein